MTSQHSGTRPSCTRASSASGGDEFAVFAGKCSAKDIEPIRARLGAGVDEYNADSGEPFRLSISVGAAAFDPASTGS